MEPSDFSASSNIEEDSILEKVRNKFTDTTTVSSLIPADENASTE